MENKILFNHKTKGYQYLSNFYPSKITIDGKVYFHVEGYYQSCKHVGIHDNLAESIRKQNNPLACKNLACSVPLSKSRSEEWHSTIKLEVMKRGILEKFKSDTVLREKLLATNDLELVEHAPWDNYWGDGPSGDGVNMLGKILVEVRTIIRDNT